jgi:site-specific recombinase XerD
MELIVVSLNPGAFDPLAWSPMPVACGVVTLATPEALLRRYEPPAPGTDLSALAPKNPWDLLELLPGYILAAKSENRAQATIDHVCLSVRTIRGFLVDHGLPTDMRLIILEHLRRYTLYLGNKERFSSHRLVPQQPGHLSGHTINNYLRGFQSFCAWLIRDKLLEFSPFAGFTVPKPPNITLPILTPEQVEAMIKSRPGNDAMAFRDRLVTIILYDTGLRASELCGLDLCNVFLDQHLLRVLGKGKIWREVPIGTRATKELWQWLKLHRPQPATDRIRNVFLTDAGKPLNKDTLGVIIRRLGQAAGITGVRLSPHTLRHTFATNYLRNGGDVLSLQRIMGHKSVETLNIYIHLSGRDLVEAHKGCSPADRMAI